MASKSPRISVIVPTYNAEKYLRRCLDSILAQTFEDFEVIVIDDGSNDGTSEICDEYLRGDNRFNIFHKKNEGVSAARQFGIERAKGIYSIHADSDDWMESIALQKMYAAIERDQADVLICDFKHDLCDKTIYCVQKPRATLADTVLRNILTGVLHGSTCNKLVRHALYKENNLRFPYGLNYCEDVLFWVDFFRNDVKVSYLPEAFYHYDLRDNNSITRNYTRNTLMLRLKFIESLQLKLASEGYESEILQVKLSIKHEAFLRHIISQDEFDKLFPEITSYEFLQMQGSFLTRCLLLAASSGFYRLAYFAYMIRTKRIHQLWYRKSFIRPGKAL
jgi:glycosyltransferase involved in cell wall biosynthesis